MRPSIEDYATIEAYVGPEDTPVYAFGYTFVYGVGPDLLPGARMQEGNTNPVRKVTPLKSWEITNNLCGSTPAREPKTMWNDDQPLLPIHLIDGDPHTAWSSGGGSWPTRQTEWIRVDLPYECEVASVALVCVTSGPLVRPFPSKVGAALPKRLTIKLSRDSASWETVYENADVPDTDRIAADFEPRPVKQIWVLAEDLRSVGNWGHAVSLGAVEVLDRQGSNLALLSRGAGVQVSSTYYGYGMDRFTQDLLWPIQYDLGFKWTRVGYDMGMYLWSYVEREKGKLEIDARADAAITDAHKCGVNVILVLDKGNWLYHDPPRKVDWKKSRVREMMETYYDHQGWPWDSPELMEGYLRYVDYMVRHFKGRVAYYEICNEWNHLPEENYHKLLLATIPVIKKADPDARIMLGSVNPGAQGGGIGTASILGCLKLGDPPVAGQIDAVGWHPFYQTDPDTAQFKSYRSDFETFRRQCVDLGFRGQYAATEWTWAAPYPFGQGAGLPTAFGCTEMQKAKYASRLMTMHSGMDVISLYNETFQTGRKDWDCTLLRNVFSVDPISPAQPQPLYYVFRSISTVTNGFQPSDFPVSFSGSQEFDCYTFARGDNELMAACWLPGRTVDGVVEEQTNLTLPGLRARKAWVVDIFNGTEQDLNITNTGGGTAIPGLLVKDYPVFVRLEA